MGLCFSKFVFLLFQSQTWGQGKKRARDPKFLVDSIPAATKFREFDPRPQDLRHTSQKEINDFLINCQTFGYESNWDAVPILYEDYELSEDQKMEIISETALFLSNMRFDLEEKYAQDPLTTALGYHVTGTLDQSDTDLWHLMRQNRITASKFKEWVSSAKGAIDRYSNSTLRCFR